MRLGLLVGIAFLAGVICPVSSAQTPDGAAIFHQKCAMCHDNPSGRIPARDMLASLPPDTIIFDLTFGVMQPQGLGLSANEIAAVATFLTGKSSSPGAQPRPDANRCASPSPAIQLDGSLWNGWGHDIENTRFQPEPSIAPPMSRSCASNGRSPILGRLWELSPPSWVTTCSSEPRTAGCTRSTRRRAAPIGRLQRDRISVDR